MSDQGDAEFVTSMEAKEPSGGTNQFSDNLVPFMYNNGKEIKKISVPARWYWGSVVKRMITHNKAHGFTGIVIILFTTEPQYHLAGTEIFLISLPLLYMKGTKLSLNWFVPPLGSFASIDVTNSASP